MAYGIYNITIFKRKGEEGQTKKIICKKNGKKEKQVKWCSGTHTRNDREDFFVDFVIL